MYDVHRLRILLELSRRGTLSAVAEAMNYSASTISQQLSTLRDEVGVALLEPVGRRVRLTPQGEILVGHAAIVVGQLEAAEAAVARSLTELTGTVRLAMFQTGLLGLLSPVLSTMAQRHPRLRTEVYQEEPEAALPRLLARDYDLVLAEEFPQQPLPRREEIDYRELVRDPMRFALPATGPTSGSGWDLVADRPWAVEPPGTPSRAWVLALCRAAGVEPDIRFTTADLLVQRRLVADGHAVAILPDLLDIADGTGVVTADIPDGPHVRRIVAATRRSSAGSAPVEACLAALLRVVGT